MYKINKTFKYRSSAGSSLLELINAEEASAMIQLDWISFPRS